MHRTNEFDATSLPAPPWFIAQSNTGTASGASSAVGSRVGVQTRPAPHAGQSQLTSTTSTSLRDRYANSYPTATSTLSNGLPASSTVTPPPKYGQRNTYEDGESPPPLVSGHAGARTSTIYQGNQYHASGNSTSGGGGGGAQHHQQRQSLDGPHLPNAIVTGPAVFAPQRNHSQPHPQPQPHQGIHSLPPSMHARGGGRQAGDAFAEDEDERGHVAPERYHEGRESSREPVEGDVRARLEYLELQLEAREEALSKALAEGRMLESQLQRERALKDTALASARYRALEECTAILNQEGAKGLERRLATERLRHGMTSAPPSSTLQQQEMPPAGVAGSSPSMMFGGGGGAATSSSRGGGGAPFYSSTPSSSSLAVDRSSVLRDGPSIKQNKQLQEEFQRSMREAFERSFSVSSGGP